MKPNICTIPITDLFTETDGCPICRMHRMLEEQYVEYITGAAMMAPDVRVITNKTGFCHRHFSMMVNTGPRLSNALLLQTHIDEQRKLVFPKKMNEPASKQNIAAITELGKTCYVCDRVEHDVLHLLRTVYTQFGQDPEFRAQYKAQDYVCLNHYSLIMTAAKAHKKAMDKQTWAVFYESTNTLSKQYMDTLYDDVTHFTTMFDYRNAGGDYKNSKDAIERSVRFLTSYTVDENLK
jgi:hypothetical protein